MHNQITIEEVHPKLREAVKEFLRKCKYPFVIVPGGAYETIGEVDYRSLLHFYDPEHPDTYAGSLRWNVHYATGKPSTFRVITRNTLNTRYQDSERRRSADTTSEKKAIKLLLEHVTPFSLPEIAENSIRVVKDVEQKWRDEFVPTEFGGFYMPRPTLHKELKNLVSQGAAFVTNEFRAAVEEGLAKYEVWAEREQIKLSKWFVKFNTHGEVLVLTPFGHTNKYSTFEALPEFIQQGVGMLKILSGADRILGLGARVTESSFWVLKKENLDVT